MTKPNGHRYRRALREVAHLLTARQQEVLARKRTPLLLVQLAREAPVGACCVCWRDVSSGRSGEERLRACGRKLPGANIAPCTALVHTLRQTAGKRQEQAKQWLLESYEGHAA